MEITLGHTHLSAISTIDDDEAWQGLMTWDLPTLDGYRSARRKEEQLNLDKKKWEELAKTSVYSKIKQLSTGTIKWVSRRQIQAKGIATAFYDADPLFTPN